MSFSNWRIALKFPSLLKILPPLLLGVIIGFHTTGGFLVPLFLLIILFGWLSQIMIVLLNDYADREADANHLKLFPDTIDERVIPLGLISPRKILGAGLIAGLLLILLGAAASLLWQRTWAPFLALIVLATYWAYSFRPFRLNYRGFGEILETTGVGFILPYGGWYLYSGILTLPPLMSYLPLLCLALAGAVFSGVKHREADKVNGKRTVIVLWGVQAAGILILGMVLASVIIGLTGYLLGKYNVWALVCISGLPAVLLLSRVKYLRFSSLTDWDALKKIKSAFSNIFLLTILGLILAQIL